MCPLGCRPPRPPWLPAFWSWRDAPQARRPSLHAAASSDGKQTGGPRSNRLLRVSRPDGGHQRGPNPRPRHRLYHKGQFRGRAGGEEGPGIVRDRSSAVPSDSGSGEGRTGAAGGGAREGPSRLGAERAAASLGRRQPGRVRTARRPIEDCQGHDRLGQSRRDRSRA